MLFKGTIHDNKEIKLVGLLLLWAKHFIQQ